MDPARETAGVLKVKEVEPEVVGGGSEEAPCSSLLQLLLRACAGCLGLHGYCSDDDQKPVAADDDDDLKPVADDEDDAAAPAVAETPQEGAGGGDDEADSVEVGARVRKNPTPPGTPRGGSGDGGGEHH